MKINFLVLVVFLSALQLKAQSQKPNDFNGWHFLQWQSDKNADEKLLKENGIEIQDAYSDAAYDRITRFHYEDMNTWLYFDSLFHLSHIDQQKDFSVVEREKADIFFGKTKKIFIQKYGEPNTEDNDTINKITTLIWNLKFTEILFTYDYRYKIIDEMGCCSYKVAVSFSPFGKADISKYAVFSLKDYLLHPFADKRLFPESTPTDLNNNEIDEIDVLLKQRITRYNAELKNKYSDDIIDMAQYVMQCVAVINKNNEKEVWVNGYCNPQNGPLVDWKKQIIIVPDGGKCFLNVKVNLTTMKFYDLKINKK